MKNKFELLEFETLESFQKRLGICLKDDGITAEELEVQESEYNG